MQKYNTPCIKTGEFARLCGTNKRTLFHYDEIGLFHPACTDDNGYRYYSESQCDVFFTIRCLRELGMPLCEIKDFLKHRNPSSLKELLIEQQAQVQKEQEHLRRIRHVIETKLSLVSSWEQLLKNPSPDSVFLDDMPEEYLVVSAPLHTNDHEQIIRTLTDHIGYCNSQNLNAGHPYGAMLDTAELRREHWDTYAYFFTKVIDRPDGHPCLVKPAGTYATTYLKGDYYNSEETYLRLFEQSIFSICAASAFLSDEFNTHIYAGSYCT